MSLTAHVQHVATKRNKHPLVLFSGLQGTSHYRGMRRPTHLPDPTEPHQKIIEHQPGVYLVPERCLQLAPPNQPSTRERVQGRNWCGSWQNFALQASEPNQLSECGTANKPKHLRLIVLPFCHRPSKIKPDRPNRRLPEDTRSDR